jgi:YesN/AraC family two-component response regulator
MNTLLRKAAENGGVHPMYIDTVSSAYAVKIETLANTPEAFEMMKDMISTYCRLVRKHSISSYSPLVQKAITMINADLSANLTLSMIAEAHNISSGYLATVFKKEVGMTVSEYIREKRINYAEHLLLTTHMQIQTVALHCGIMDVQYFSKIFKKQTGKTPKEFRNSAK